MEACAPILVTVVALLMGVVELSLTTIVGYQAMADSQSMRFAPAAVRKSVPLRGSIEKGAACASFCSE